MIPHYRHIHLCVTYHYPSTYAACPVISHGGPWYMLVFEAT